MGGKAGGTQCINMVEARDKDGNVIYDGNGKPILSQCPYVFMSTKQSMVVKRKMESSQQESTMSMWRPKKIHQLQQAFYGEIGSDAKLTATGQLRSCAHMQMSKEAPKLGGELYVGMIAPTTTSDLTSDAMQRFFAGPDSDSQGGVNAVLLQHMTGARLVLVCVSGPAVKHLFADSDELDHKLGNACDDMCSVAQSLSSKRICTPQAPVETKCSLQDLLVSYSLEQYYSNLINAGFDLDRLVNEVVGNQQNKGTLSGQCLAEKAALPIGAACKQQTRFSRYVYKDVAIGLLSLSPGSLLSSLQDDLWSQDLQNWHLPRHTATALQSKIAYTSNHGFQGMPSHTDTDTEASVLYRLRRLLLSVAGFTRELHPLYESEWRRLKKSRDE
eukprot:scaffold136362_cov46-Prasinocladus_malaysianus.AAC.3